MAPLAIVEQLDVFEDFAAGQGADASGSDKPVRA